MRYSKARAHRRIEGGLLINWISLHGIRVYEWS